MAVTGRLWGDHLSRIPPFGPPKNIGIHRASANSVSAVIADRARNPVAVPVVFLPVVAAIKCISETKNRRYIRAPVSRSKLEALSIGTAGIGTAGIGTAG